MIQLLQELLWAYGPCGQEDAVREICLRGLAPWSDSVWVDKAGNVVGRVSSSARDGHRATPMAHMDELSMLVKRIQPDGRVRLTPLGTMYPANFGLGPVMMLGDREHVCGVLTVGSEHTAQESPQIWQTKPDGGDRALNWSDVYVFTGRTPEQLTAAGVRPGTRVCVHRSKRELVEIDDFLGSYFMDDRALLVVLLSAVRALRQRPERPPQDVMFVCTVSEEVGGLGGSYASRALPGGRPWRWSARPKANTAPLSQAGPSSATAMRSASTTRASRTGWWTWRPSWAPIRSRQSWARSDPMPRMPSRTSTRPRPGCCACPRWAHGYEVVPRDGIGAMSDVLVEFLMQPVPFAEGTSRVNRAAPGKDAPTASDDPDSDVMPSGVSGKSPCSTGSPPTRPKSFPAPGSSLRACCW